MKKRLRELGLLSLEKKWLCRDLIEAFQYLKRAHRKTGDGLFIREWNERTRDNGSKQKERRYRLDISKRYFTMRVVRQWNRLPSEAVDAPSLEVFSARLEGVSAHIKRVGTAWSLISLPTKIIL